MMSKGGRDRDRKFREARRRLQCVAPSPGDSPAVTDLAAVTVPASLDDVTELDPIVSLPVVQQPLRLTEGRSRQPDRRDGDDECVDEGDRLISIKDFARRLGRCVKTIKRQMERCVNFPIPIMQGRNYFFALSEVNAYIEREIRNAHRGIMSR